MPVMVNQRGYDAAQREQRLVDAASLASAIVFRARATDAL
jgi:hypothetical protein